MKKIIYSSVLASLLLASPTFAAEGGLRARIASTTERIKEVKTEVKDRIEDRKASSTASTTARRVERRDNRTLQLVKHASEVLSSTADRLEKISLRVESRIAKVKAAGGDTSASEQALAAARGHIADARAKLALFSTADLSADKFSDTVARLRDAAAGIKEDLKAAQASLSEAISSLKPGRSEDRDHATSTATSTRDN